MKPPSPHKPSKRSSFTITAGPYQFNFGKRTHLMGIINATPDSFSGDGLFRSKQRYSSALKKIEEMIKDGADIIDIGGESTRPGAKTITAKEEMTRTIPLVKAVTKKFSIPVSVDTYKPDVAKAALDAGAVIINDIMGSKPDPTLLKMVKNYKAVIVLMHIRGTPQTMQKNIRYRDVVNDIIRILGDSMEKCLEIGIKSDKIIIDPGIGFGKTVDQNLTILNRLNELSVLHKPILVGTSRKSFIGKILNQNVHDRLMGTAATVAISILKGAHIVRVHDVRAMKEVALMSDGILNQSY